jgi:hypothetical protein
MSDILDEGLLFYAEHPTVVIKSPRRKPLRDPVRGRIADPRGRRRSADGTRQE